MSRRADQELHTTGPLKLPIAVSTFFNNNFFSQTKRKKKLHNGVYDERCCVGYTPPFALAVSDAEERNNTKQGAHFQEGASLFCRLATWTKEKPGRGALSLKVTAEPDGCYVVRAYPSLLFVLWKGNLEEEEKKSG